MRKLSVLYLLLTCLFFTTSSLAAPPSESIGPPQTREGGCTLEEVWVTAANGAKVYTNVYRPKDFSKEKKYPAVLTYGPMGGTQQLFGGPFGVRDVNQVLNLGIMVVTFDMEGSGRTQDTNREERFLGPKNFADLHAVLQYAESLPEVNKDCVGLISFSGGCVSSAAVLSEHPNDPPVKFWIDGEGPSDRYVICFAIAGTEPKMPAHVEFCDDAFWMPREAFRRMDKIKCGYYLRLQAESDHAQDWFYGHAIQMLNAAAGKSCPWTRCNSGPVNAHHTGPKTLDLLPGRIREHPDKFLAYLQEMINMPPL